MTNEKRDILLVEDEDNIARALAFLLRKMGHTTCRVADGDAALEAIQSRRPDLVVLDVMLPRRSGYEVCQQIRKLPELRRTKVLMMTAGGGEVERRKGLALGADAFLVKPFATADLTAVIAELLDDVAAV